MTAQQIQQFVAENVKYKNWKFVVHEATVGPVKFTGLFDSEAEPGTPYLEQSDIKGMYLQLEFNAPDNYNPSGPTTVQKSRKWQLSEWMTPSEIVQTCFAAVMRAETHEVAELFKYKDKDVYNRHIDVDQLHAICDIVDTRH